MAKFDIHVIGSNGAKSVLTYDSETSSLTDANGNSVVPVAPTDHSFAKPVSESAPGLKHGVKTLKISLGLSCNYECSYCSQRFVPHADSTNPDSIDNFIAMVRNAGMQPDRIEFWGGEPLVYWKTLKPLAERLRGLFPFSALSMVTNGSLLDQEKNEWIERMGFSIGLSHDGPGYHARGLDPLDNPTTSAAIMDLYRRLKPQGRISINAMMHGGNISRAEVQEWLKKRFGEDVRIGEGFFIDPYDEGGLASTLQSHQEHVAYRQRAYRELRMGAAVNFTGVADKIVDFVNSIKSARPSASLGQKCHMDKPHNLAVDLNGNVITCQNVSAAAIAPNGQPHKIGHITALQDVKLRTSTHWSKRKDCSSCPVLQLCKGSCMFLEGRLWDSGCDAAYSDNIPFLAAAIEFMTGLIPFYIEGDFREDRKDIFGQFTKQEAAGPAKGTKRVIPIMAV